VYFELADYDGDGEVEALTASEQGIGLYSPRGPRTCWEQMTDAPPVGVGVLPGVDGEAARIVYGRQDGYVFVLSATGEVLASAVLGEPLQSLTVMPGPEPTVWVGTRSELIGLRPTDLTAVWRQSGSYQKLMIQRVNGRQRVLGVTVGGALEAFDPG
jgi:hypothetical protein